VIRRDGSVGVSGMLDYAGTQTPVPPRRWPLVVVGVFAVVVGGVLLVQNCALGIRHVADAGHTWREEAWGRALGTGSGCLLMLASGCWFARRAGTGPVVTRRVMRLGVVIWLTSCLIMAVRAV
jgi:hypothetical protein